jgi:hypothetical protein
MKQQPGDIVIECNGRDYLIRKNENENDYFVWSRSIAWRQWQLLSSGGGRTYNKARRKNQVLALAREKGLL